VVEGESVSRCKGHWPVRDFDYHPHTHFLRDPSIFLACNIPKRSITLIILSSPTSIRVWSSGDKSMELRSLQREGEEGGEKEGGPWCKLASYQ